MKGIIEELSIEETIINYIFDEIFDKKFHPGMKLSESVFAQTFDASRDAVRKAFSQLQSMGIVTYKKNQGFFLRWLTKEDTEDVYAARNIIEAGIITLVTQKHAIGLIDLSYLKNEVETEKYLKISLRKGEYVKTSCDFHLNLAFLSGNDFLINALKPLIPLSILAGLVYEDSSSHFCSYDEHNNLIKAIKSNDIDYAKSIMNHHLHHCVEALDFNKTIKKKSLISLRIEE
ncbi:GntR family transcriptional regulator [Poseidonibacter lekithochrous]|uniref:GntR family transcriptional regulator n=1 Tax=Poseidonibacter TaxID=2321187 RepID=UPI001C08A7E8|nr:MULTISPECIES: GntR family transcriptional regulator [Poseidonibacter]MBU3013911.1 GntR family transcriptional regulator [Poseidonibacter lekithochrous]MDO6827206.1 GntR family transcriptional regulator [Poseidonibacter sp. 1_MG-2023]